MRLKPVSQTTHVAPNVYYNNTPYMYICMCMHIIYCLSFTVKNFHIFCRLLCSHKYFVGFLHMNTMIACTVNWEIFNSNKLSRLAASTKS